MTGTLDHVDDTVVTAFVDEMLDATSDLGELAAAAFGIDADTAWHVAVTHIGNLYAGTTERSRGKNNARRARATLLLRRLLSNPHTTSAAMHDAIDTAKAAGIDWIELGPLLDNPTASTDVLEHAGATFGSALICWGGGLSHPNTSRDLIHRMLDGRVTIKAADQLLTRADLDDDLLNWAAQNCLDDTVDRFAQRDDLSEDSYRHLAARGLDQRGANNGGAYGGVRRYLADNPAVPAGLLGELSRDDHAQVRRAVAANPATDDTVLHDLLDDDHDRVVAAAFRQLRARGTITI